ncbi:MAG TPA: hypothetical protein VFX98_13515 [Longimicrobiaceae bacterium]|nr:hypothetical protein [Longimicrobiaceae bacterium]
MYRNCIFCSAELGANDALEAFPVGRSLAFDGWKGRLWAICPKCARWNLAPLEERWEAIESADRLFTDARLRVQSENIGLARLRDGTRLIRVGEALPGELAAWRYGDQLVKRRKQYLIAAAAAAAGGLVVLGGIVALTSLGGIASMSGFLSNLWQQRERRKVVHHIPAAASPTGVPLVIRRWHVQGAVLGTPPPGEPDAGIRLLLTDVSLKDPKTDRWGSPTFTGDKVALGDAAARTVLNRALVHLNEKGASRAHLQRAVGMLETAGSAEDFVRQTAAARRALGKQKGMEKQALGREASLALEMALHEEAERRALQGELTVLESAWRQAEEIAAIADALPDDPLQRLRG